MIKAWLNNALLMSILRTAWFRGLNGAVNVLAMACLSLSLTLAGGQDSAGEPIQFSDSEKDLIVPHVSLDSKHLSRPFEFLDRENSVGGVMENVGIPGPASSPNFQRNPRLWESFEQKMDQKRNWVYGRAEDLNHQPTLAEMFGVRDSEAGAGNRKHQGAIARYFEERNQKYSSSRRGDSSQEDLTRHASDGAGGSEFERKSGADESLRPLRPFDMNRAVTAGFSIPDSPFAAPRAEGNLSSRSPQNAGDHSRDAQTPTDDFRKLLVTPHQINPLIAGFDPIDVRADSTREEMNPVVALPAVGASRFGAGAFDSLRSGARINGSRELSALEEMNAKVLGPSSLSPAVAPLAEPRYTTPKPAVFEFPRRKF
jgi:hypothetical protein